jgi:FkbM family methyltransferase
VLIQSTIRWGYRYLVPLRWRERRARPTIDPPRTALVGGMQTKTYDLAQKRLIATKDDFFLYVFDADYISDGIERHGSFEPYVGDVLKAHLRPGSTFWDIGGNLGYFTCLGAKLVGPQGRVVAFEPNPTNVAMIRASLAVNGSTNATVHQLAVSDGCAELPFVTVGTNGGVVTPQSGSQPNLTVRSVDLDTFLPADCHVDFIKIDVEAHEPAALKGMQKIIRRCRPIIVSEVHPWALERNGGDAEALLDQLAAPGYSIAVIPQSGPLIPVATTADAMRFWRGLGEKTMQFDVLATPL